MSKTKQTTAKTQETLKTAHLNLAKELDISVSINDVLNHLEFLTKIDDNGQNKFYNEKSFL